MGKRKVILYIVDTTYQFISAVNTAVKSFDSDCYDNHIYYLKKHSSGENELDETHPLGNGFIKLMNDGNKEKLYKELVNQKVYRFFFYQEGEILNKYLAYGLKQSGAKIALGPDGSKPYGVYSKKHEFLSALKDTLSDHYKLMNMGLHISKLRLSWYYRYGYDMVIDEVWLQYPELFDTDVNFLRRKKEIHTLPEFETETIKFIGTLLGWRNDEIELEDKPIIYFNQPYWSNELQQKEYSILRELVDLFPEKTIYLKIHPNTREHVRKEYTDIDKLMLIGSNIPSELLFIELHDAILLTGWSASIMHNLSPSSKYFYLLPLFKELNDVVLNQLKLTSFPHVKELDELSQLKVFV